MTFRDGVLVYRFLNNANIFEQYKQLVCVILTEIKYENMKDQIKNNFSDSTNFSCTAPDEQSIKVEPTYHQDVFYSSSNNFFLQKEVVLILDIEIIDFLIRPIIVVNLVKI